MKIIINVVLVLVVAALAYFLYDSINDPIVFQAEKKRREQRVVEKLKEIRQCQEYYHEITGKYASNFDELAEVLRNDDFMIVSIMGDPDDPNFDEENIVYDTIFAPAIDSVRKYNIDLDDLRYVPYTDQETFDIAADSMIYQSIKTYTVEVGVKRAKFMGPFADNRYTKYDQTYDPSSKLKFGSLTSPNTTGNWE